ALRLPRRDRRGGAVPVTSNDQACRGRLCRLMFRHMERHARQLQHGRPLALQETGEGQDRTVREFERIMMRAGDVQIDLPEPGDIARRRLLPVRDRMLVAWRRIEHELRSRPQAYRRVEVASSGKASGDGVVEVGGDQAIGDRSRPRRHVFETVVTHDTFLLLLPPANETIIRVPCSCMECGTWYGALHLP